MVGLSRRRIYIFDRGGARWGKETVKEVQEIDEEEGQGDRWSRVARAGLDEVSGVGFLLNLAVILISSIDDVNASEHLNAITQISIRGDDIGPDGLCSLDDIWV